MITQAMNEPGTLGVCICRLRVRFLTSANHFVFTPVINKITLGCYGIVKVGCQDCCQGDAVVVYVVPFHSSGTQDRVTLLGELKGGGSGMS